MSSSNEMPATPDENDPVTVPSSPDSEVNSTASTPFDDTPPENLFDRGNRIPSLRSISDPPNINPNSTAKGVLGMARKPPSSVSSFTGAGAIDNNILAKARALHQQRLQKGISPGLVSPTSPSSQPPSGPNGFPPLQFPGQPQRPLPVNHPKSAPILPKPTLGKGRGLSLSQMGPMRRPGAPTMLDMGGSPASRQDASPAHQGTKMDEFKKYIDAEKGWLTFDGAATITQEGVNFNNGHTFSISLDEVDILEELGKGNYGTVYKAKHARPRVPRFGHGLSGVKPHIHHTQSDAVLVTKHEKDGSTSGITMAMKEIRLELDDAKFTTILKELVILHECVSPYIIDFYGAFFQDGAVYMCIEYMDGGSIDKLYSGGIPESILRKITYSTVMGLKSLKDEHNIIHRDVKPTNILVNTRGQVKICDFGVSGNLVASIAKTNIGCQSYMAPERIAGGGMAQSGNPDGTYSVQSDIWSLGLTIIECATGQYPYPPEVSATIFSQLSAIVEGDPPGLPDEGYSDTVKDFVKSCLHKIPKQRPTYAMLLKHPWLKSFTKPETITEEAEEGEEAEKMAESIGNLNLNSKTEDSEVAGWVKSVLAKKAEGSDSGLLRPALHAAPLDSVSPLASPGIPPSQ